MKALIVDDSGVMRKIIIRSLLSLGPCEFVEAVNGKDAFEKFVTEPFDLVLTDWNMPVRNGLELVQDIRGAQSQVPIIMITTEAQKGQITLAIEAGVSDYLTKPFDNDELRAKLEQFIAA